MHKPWSIWIGYDSRQPDAFLVARESIRRRLTAPIPIHGIGLDQVVEKGLYTRVTTKTRDSDGNLLLIDEASKRPDYNGAMSTEFAISRFLTPTLGRAGLALFVDSDVMAFDNVARLFEAHQPGKALMCVQHDYRSHKATKMDGQANVGYSRKNWSSVMLFDCDHPANDSLTPELLNSLPGKDLHRFCWLDDAEIGALEPRWNWLVGEQAQPANVGLAHYTLGTPAMPGYGDAPYAPVWRAELASALGLICA